MSVAPVGRGGVAVVLVRGWFILPLSRSLSFHVPPDSGFSCKHWLTLARDMSFVGMTFCLRGFLPVIAGWSADHAPVCLCRLVVLLSLIVVHRIPDEILGFRILGTWRFSRHMVLRWMLLT